MLSKLLCGFIFVAVTSASYGADLIGRPDNLKRSAIEYGKALHDLAALYQKIANAEVNASNSFQNFLSSGKIEYETESETSVNEAIFYQNLLRTAIVRNNIALDEFKRQVEINVVTTYQIK